MSTTKLFKSWSQKLFLLVTDQCVIVNLLFLATNLDVVVLLLFDKSQKPTVNSVTKLC